MYLKVKRLKENKWCQHQWGCRLVPGGLLHACVWFDSSRLFLFAVCCLLSTGISLLSAVCRRLPGGLFSLRLIRIQQPPPVPFPFCLTPFFHKRND
jgi:hypothetical protein